MEDVKGYLDKTAQSMDLVEHLTEALRDSLDGAVMIRIMDDKVVCEPVSLQPPRGTKDF